MSLLKTGNAWAARRTTGDDLRGVAHDPVIGLWVFVGRGAPVPFDGELLTIPGTSLVSGSPSFTGRFLSGNDELNSVAASGDGSFWAVGENQETYHSIDGITWTLFFMPGGLFDSKRIAFGQTELGGLYLVSGRNVLSRETSPGSFLWTVIDSSTHNQTDVANDDGANWVSVGGTVGDGTIRTSTTGTSFLVPSSEFTELAEAVDWGGVWVVVGENGFIATSLTGLTGSWGAQISPVSTDLLAVLHLDGQRWIAAGAGGVILISNDHGQTWAQVGVGVTAEDMHAIAYDPIADVAAVCGDGGVVLTSQPLEIGDLAPTPVAPEPLTANSRMIQEAIGRLAGQFRSGSGEPE
ncbi:hypothetical protein LCGC14_1578900 [marine sediment metagenome]|uniref:Photosynthesis system II assembly factor Ycf48/Hcf136-like domain-containing protein n=1 Tax=marine sediment metagenome TaxID=412755 RepID=A0A0F9J3L2_9ZZZZ